MVGAAEGLFWADEVRTRNVKCFCMSTMGGDAMEHLSHRVYDQDHVHGMDRQACAPRGVLLTFGVPSSSGTRSPIGLPSSPSRRLKSKVANWRLLSELLGLNANCPILSKSKLK